jgi:hypothetical protein
MDPEPRVVSIWWMVVAILLAVLIVVVVVLSAFATHQVSVTRTQVDWYAYTVPGGPGTGGSGPFNYTILPDALFCAPSNALSYGRFAMTWSTIPTTSVPENVRLWTLYPPTPSHPIGVPTVLYQSYNVSQGGTSFVSAFPLPCGDAWILNVNATVPLSVTAVMTLTYNYTAEETESSL